MRTGFSTQNFSATQGAIGAPEQLRLAVKDFAAGGQGVLCTKQLSVKVGRGAQTFRARGNP